MPTATLCLVRQYSREYHCRGADRCRENQEQLRPQTQDIGHIYLGQKADPLPDVFKVNCQRRPKPRLGSAVHT
jgi:hypothetical protein